MDGAMLDAAWSALLIMLDPMRLLYLTAGVVLGLVIGILPGVGGVAGIALLLPFTFGMDPYAAFAFLLGLGSVTATGDTIPAILFGVPGGSSAQATVLDGLPMTQKGEAGRALAAAYIASMMGGLFGALVLGLSIPILKPVMLYVGSPELLAFAVFGISMVASLSGSAPMRGLTAAALGVLLSFIGSDPQSGTLRWTFGSLYLFDGLPLLPVALGIFALPELAELFIKRTAVAQGTKYDVWSGMRQGTMDVFRHWFLVFRCSSIGAAIGALPGLGSAVVGWFAYAHAARSERGARQSFGTGDVRGVIAPESANNATEGGGLVPTIAFGVPGSASMAILLGAFLIHGLQPGPQMLTRNLDLTYSMVWTLALANVIGTGLCFAFSGQFAKLSVLRYTLILPLMMAIIYVGAFQGSRDWGDLYALLFFGVLGWTMKRLGWPRPPLILGFVLGAIIERYMFISTMRWGWEWLFRPLVATLLVLSLISLMRPLISEGIARFRGAGGAFFGKPSFRREDLFGLLILLVVGGLMFTMGGWNRRAVIAPEVVGTIALVTGTLAFLGPILRRQEGGGRAMDLASDTGDMESRAVLLRAGLFFGWLLAFIVSMAVIGLIPTAALFVIVFMRTEGPEPWPLVLWMTGGLTLMIWVVFDQFLRIPWPPTVLGELIPALTVIPSM